MRGVPESVEPGNITSALQYVLNDLLERQTDTPIDFDRAHRALRARPADSAPPRDIICCIPNFKLKEDIMAKARRNEHITFNDTDIYLPGPFAHHVKQESSAPPAGDTTQTKHTIQMEISFLL